MAYRVMDVARYVINVCNKNGYGITNLRLQKILYFIQVDFLTNLGKPCFDEDIEAWNFGPVIPEVYHEFKCYGNSKIPLVRRYIENETNIWDSQIRYFDYKKLDKEDRRRIEDIIRQCERYTTSELVEITHNQTPWVQAYKRRYDNIITRDSLVRYFK